MVYTKRRGEHRQAKKQNKKKPGPAAEEPQTGENDQQKRDSNGVREERCVRMKQSERVHALGAQSKKSLDHRPTAAHE